MTASGGRQATCAGISAILASGNFDKSDVLHMTHELQALAQEMSWEARSLVRGRNVSPVAQQVERKLAAAQTALTWADTHASYVLLIELVRYVIAASDLVASAADSLSADASGISA